MARNTTDEEAQVGLCLHCRHARIVISRAESRFYLCKRSRTDPTYPKYPRLPVLRCGGYEREGDSAGS
ncbi:MAG: hypothetical protein F4Y00_11315 [Bacteroidetes bacterium SB0662_bin_6]|nr:hypothetical protein [Bacteroidetes bacterium SB0668_bin_1]MYE05542.1 hypothetical protein [Bacteroidetes bacterium SB0662_bin_6]